MKAVDFPTEKLITDRPAVNRSEADHYWQTAGERVLLYLRCLNFPAPQALELALRALETAERKVDLSSGNTPVAQSMQALNELLSKQKTDMVDHEHPIVPLPPLRRLPMVPEGIAPAPWRSVLATLFNPYR